MKQNSKIPKISQEAVLVKSDDSFIDKTQIIKGYDFNSNSNSDDSDSSTTTNFEKLFLSYNQIGFQASNVGKSIKIINKMIKEKNPKCKIFLGYTSNMISCGIREIIRFLVEHKFVDCVVTTAGGIEEDIMKCLADTYLGRFDLKGEMLRKKGVNRIGNLLVPNDNYCKFENWINPILDKMLEEQKNEKIIWSPSKMIRRFGKEINNKESVYYWCAKNNIPVYCPAITDGSIGDMIFFHSFNKPGLVVDLVQDIIGMNKEALDAKKTGMIILGGGVTKHHICNANLMRNGADYSVFINTAQEFDGSDAGARPDEAISWGKIKVGAEAVKVYADASIVFPIIVSQTFAKLKTLNKKDKK